MTCSTVRNTCSTALAFAGDRIAWATIALLRHRTFGLDARSELNGAGLADQAVTHFQFAQPQDREI